MRQDPSYDRTERARHDRDRTRAHQADHDAPDRRAAWPKDDQRSSSRLSAAADHLTVEERQASWPLG